MMGKPRERTALTSFLPTQASDYLIRSERYIAFERFTTSFLCKQDFIEPNHITYFRVVICLCLLVLSNHLSYLQILIVAVLGALSDFFDGAYARSASKRTRLGIILDPAADKFLVLVLVYILVRRDALDPLYLLFIAMMEGHMVVLPILSWLYGVQKRRSNDERGVSIKRDRNIFILKSEAALMGKVKFLLYACALMGILIGRAFDSLVLLKVADWLMILGIAAGAMAFCSYIVRWIKHPYFLA